MNKKNPLLWLLPLILIIVGVVGLVFGVRYFQGDNKSQNSKDIAIYEISSDLADFENTFYDYLASSLEKIITQTKNQEVPPKKINELTQKGISMINDFVDVKKKEGKILSEADNNRLNQLRFYVHSSIAIDEVQTRKILDHLPNNSNKLSLIYTYLETFISKKFRPNTSDEVFYNFLQEQKTWALNWETNYDNKIDTLIFKADPIGRPMPNYLVEHKSIDNKSLDLKNFKGKYVLLDFWATWCLPCIAELPYLIESYQRFYKKGFEIISISLDKNEKNFKDFVKERDIPWIQYFDGKGFQGEVVRDYGISTLPTLYLTDRKGRVISANMRGEELIKILETKFQ